MSSDPFAWPLFTGHQWYSDIGLYDMRNRFYSPDLGRFIQPDPIGFAGDHTNIYRYCGNNPHSRIDPFGLEDIWDSQPLQADGGSGDPDVTYGGEEADPGGEGEDSNEHYGGGDGGMATADPVVVSIGSGGSSGGSGVAGGVAGGAGDITGSSDSGGGGESGGGMGGGDDGTGGGSGDAGGGGSGGGGSGGGGGASGGSAGGGGGPAGIPSGRGDGGPLFIIDKHALARFGPDPATAKSLRQFADFTDRSTTIYVGITMGAWAGGELGVAYGPSVYRFGVSAYGATSRGVYQGFSYAYANARAVTAASYMAVAFTESANVGTEYVELNLQEEMEEMVEWPVIVSGD